VPEATPPKRVRRKPDRPAPVPAPAPEPQTPPPPPRPTGLGRLAFLADRTAVLFIGIAVGVTIALAFLAKEAAPPAPPAPGPTIANSSGPAAPGAPPIAGATTGAATCAGDPTAVDCVGPITPRLLETVKTGGVVNVGVFGDSFGEGIWAALYWTLPKSDHYQIFKFAERSTGFTRYQSLNLEDKATSDIAGQPIDIAVINFGANDTQGIIDDGHVYALLSPGWKTAYGARVARFVGLLRKEGAMVYWVGLPKMRSPQFDSQIVAMNEFYRQEMASLGVPFFPTEALSVDDTGQFNIYLPDPKTHKEEVMRANDGIHMSIPGYERISAALVDRIKAYVARARQTAGVPPPAPPQVATAASSGPAQ
jgi:hypothetical protein